MKKLLCLICLALLLAACTSDSTTPATAPAQSVAQEAADADVTMGHTIYQQSCKNCHDAGLMGAPMLGDERYSADIEVLVENSINGIGLMPARGGNSSLSDAEIRAVVEYMVDQSK